MIHLILTTDRYKKTLRRIQNGQSNGIWIYKVYMASFSYAAIMQVRF